jgi:spore coat polysaccharide biosynthesis predicted glycosyltransferase SpsG
MKFSFRFDYGQKPEVGTGHKYRCEALGNELRNRGHYVSMQDDQEAQVAVLDFVGSAKVFIDEARSRNQKIVLIDGVPEDVPFVDLSISAVFNKGAQYKGLRYTVFPKPFHASFYNAYTLSDTVFVGLGGFDYNNYVDLALQAIGKAGLKALVGKNINLPDISRYPFAQIHDDENYFTAMKNCVMAVTNGGLTLFQALYFGMPCIPIAQYEHQKTNIAMVDYACLPSEPNLESMADKLIWLYKNSDMRNSLSRLARHTRVLAEFVIY